MIEQPPVRRPRRRARRLATTLLVTTTLILFAGGSWFAWATGGAGKGSAVEVEIPAGASASTIADRLADAGVVRSAFAFRLLAKFRGVSTDFKPGTYRLRKGLSVSAAIEALRSGVPEEVMRFTVPEGLTVRQTAARVEKETEGRITARAFLAALVAEKDLPGALQSHVTQKSTRVPEDFEGFLFPDTYEIFKKSTAADVVRRMLDRFERSAGEAGIDEGAHGLSPYELVIAASLVEKEARCREDLIEGKAPCADDHVNIASVIYNRLERPMRLQIDATIQYVYIQRTGRAKNPLQISDYQLESRYNTYLHDGLPPTPIGAPGAESLRAVVKPASTGFFFYRLCNPDALRFGHIFGTTIQERDSRWRSDPRCG